MLTEKGEPKKFSYEDCPCCNCCSIRVTNGKIARHEKGLGYVPYRFYHKRAVKYGYSVKEQAKRDLCLASGLTMEEAYEEAETIMEKYCMESG